MVNDRISLAEYLHSKAISFPFLAVPFIQHGPNPRLLKCEDFREKTQVWVTENGQ